MPQVFFNSRHVGGREEVERWEREGVLGDRVRECLEGGSEEFPPPIWTPQPQEFVQVLYIYHPFHVIVNKNFTATLCVYIILIARSQIH